MKFYDYDDNNVLQTVAETTIIWDSANEPTNYKWSQILYDIRRADANQNLFLEPITEKEILDYYADQILTFDALVVQNNQLEKEMKIFERLMNNVGENLKVSAMQQTTPFTKNGVANVCNIFELSDGQTITIFFHSPDTTPKKITPTDNLISYKWVLNKKDITIVVAPERGKDLNVREVCRRIMKLAEKNSAAFARANKNRAEKAQKLADTENEISQLETQLTDLQQQLEIAKVKRDDLQIQLAEQSKNDFRDDGVKVNIKNNEKLQDVNNVQPDDENLNNKTEENNFVRKVVDITQKNWKRRDEYDKTSSLLAHYIGAVEDTIAKLYANDDYNSSIKDFVVKLLDDYKFRQDTFRPFLIEANFNALNTKEVQAEIQSIINNMDAEERAAVINMANKASQITDANKYIITAEVNNAIFVDDVYEFVKGNGYYYQHATPLEKGSRGSDETHNEMAAVDFGVTILEKFGKWECYYNAVAQQYTMLYYLPPKDFSNIVKNYIDNASEINIEEQKEKALMKIINDGVYTGESYKPLNEQATKEYVKKMFKLKLKANLSSSQAEDILPRISRVNNLKELKEAKRIVEEKLNKFYLKYNN